MSIGSWDPSQSIELSHNDLTQLLALTDDQILDIQSQFDHDFFNRIKPLMKQNLAFWKTNVDHLNDEQLTQLMKVFTLLEVKVDDFACLDKSPVVWIGKLLKSRKAFPEKRIIDWMKANTDNKFIPHGSLF
ncbi:hypothetical protein [Marinicellulosiphila megalodicopiae]|uniref:hypothetical protein n=1 Tax=Marinicellulosiphila megalodicopiae TaxID=2724896 RepID=UPI003BAFFC33